MESIAFKAAFTRGLRVLAVAFAECVGPSQWGLKPESSQVRHEAKFALETLFKVSFILTTSFISSVYRSVIYVGGSFRRLPSFIGGQIAANRGLYRLDARFNSLRTSLQDQSHGVAPTSGPG